VDGLSGNISLMEAKRMAYVLLVGKPDEGGQLEERDVG
jgi:hypothetical protein